MQCRCKAGTGQIAYVSMCVSVFFCFFLFAHMHELLSSVCHSGPCAADVCAAHCTAEWGTAWAWPAISPPTTRTDTQAGLCLCFSLQERVCARVYVCMRVCVFVCVCVCVCVCICRVNTNHPFPLTPSLSLSLSLSLSFCMCLSLIISVSTSSSGDTEDCSCPYDNLSATVNQPGLPYPSLACFLHMWPSRLWQVCRWRFTQLYSSHQQLHIALTLTYYVVVHLWQRSCHLLATSDQIILLSLVHALYVQIKRSQCAK